MVVAKTNEHIKTKFGEPWLKNIINVEIVKICPKQNLQCVRKAIAVKCCSRISRHHSTINYHNVNSQDFKVSQIPYPNAENYVLNHSKSNICHRKCMHARIQSPRVWKNIQDLNLGNFASLDFDMVLHICRTRWFRQ